MINDKPRVMYINSNAVTSQYIDSNQSIVDPFVPCIAMCNERSMLSRFGNDVPSQPS